MIVRFTNAKGKVNHGIVLAHGTHGCIQVLWDRFGELIADLNQRGKLRKSDSASLDARISWISLEPSPYVAIETKSELLPAETFVAWSNSDLAQAQAMLQAGTEAFALWLAESWPELSRKYVLRAKAA